MKIITNNILSKLFRFLSNCEDFVFLDTSKPDEMNRRSLLFVEPVERLLHYEGQSEEDFLQAIQQKQLQGYYVAGWFSYEFGYLLETSLKKRLSRNSDRQSLLADLGVFKKCFTFDHDTGENDFPVTYFDGDDLDDAYHVRNLRTTQTEMEYIRALEQVLKYIEAGDTYQVNYTLKLLFDFQGSCEKFYSDLRRNQSVSYGAYIRSGDSRVMSFSPELFFWKNEDRVVVRPMKGTVKRGKTADEDNAQRQFLKSDIKNQSENVMIVDLLRNDLGRLMHHIADGDVQVDSLFDVETYETLLQMTSTITGKTNKEELKNVSLHAFFKAIFPCGSVTGAPKIRTMEIIDELEKDRRGVYTGAIGYMMPGGEAVFNVPIRTVVLKGRQGEMGIGSGIVHDSDPQQEWQECLLKGKFLTAPRKKFQLFETLLWQPDSGYFLLDFHLSRLKESAEYFLFSCDINCIKDDLATLAEGFADTPQRVRLILEKDGVCTFETAVTALPAKLELPLRPDSPGAELPKIAVSNQRIDSEMCWFYHKTTNRDIYSGEYLKATADNLFDLVFINEKGRVTEGCISSIFVFVDGRYYTPPVSDGLLPGVMRRYLLANAETEITEKSITVEELERADALFLCNSVRGVTQVKL